MKAKITAKVQQLKEDPKVTHAISSIRPEKSIWGFLGVIVFFILPEVIAFFWAVEITAYAKEALAYPTTAAPLSYYYEVLILLFEEGVSWVNLSIGIALLFWLFV